MTQPTADPLLLHTDYTALPAPVRHSAITPALFGLLCLNMVATAFDVVLWVRFIKTMKGSTAGSAHHTRDLHSCCCAGFSWFVSQALYPVSLALVLGPLVGWRLVTGRIAPSNFSFPKALLLLLAGCGVAQNRLMTAGTLSPTTGVSQPLSFNPSSSQCRNLHQHPIPQLHQHSISQLHQTTML